MTCWTIDLSQVGAADLLRVGGKGANLGLLTAAGLPVPPGFCVTTDAFRRFVEGEALHPLFADLDAVSPGDLSAARACGAALRDALTARPIPAELSEAIIAAWCIAGDQQAYAVRSSATAEDLPDASFAGQQDSYLQVIGEASLLDRVRACWASLYTDRAILYRLQNGIVHRDVALSVVVQKMVLPQASGILFTADPLTGQRQTVSIDAGFGLGETLVSGLVNADLYRVDKRDGRILEVRVGDKQLAILPLDGGGTRTEQLGDERRRSRVLTDEQARQLAALGTRIETLLGSPQDIEWCIEQDEIFIVQSRPITSLYPLPERVTAGDSLEVYFCFNHFQVMTDAMPPMSCSLWMTAIPLGKDPRKLKQPSRAPWVRAAGGRLFIDLSRLLRFPPTRHLIGAAFGFADELAHSALMEVASRPGFARGPRIRPTSLMRFMLSRLICVQKALWLASPDGVGEDRTAGLYQLIASTRARITAGKDSADRLTRARIELTGIFEHIFEFPPLFVAGLLAGGAVRRLAGAKPSDPDVAAIGRGLKGNLTTEMDLAVGDLADVARGHDALVLALQSGESDRALLFALPGGEAFEQTLTDFLLQYGARAPSEIDTSRPRWREDPSSILRAVAGNLAHAQQGAHRARHAELALEAERAGQRLIDRAGRGPLGLLKRRLAARLFRVFRGLAGLREHPKFGLIGLLDVIRSEILRAGEELEQTGRLASADDVWLLELEELLEAVSQPGADLRELVEQRRSELEHARKLYPPRVMTSEGEIPSVSHDADVPEGALARSAVSAGIVEGIARVIRDPASATLHKGEILVAPFTDPGWTPLFLNAAGLVMEVGGLMTHGSVVAREYGIPAVVCIPGVTGLIQTGQRIRVNGDGGYVQILEDSP